MTVNQKSSNMSVRRTYRPAWEGPIVPLFLKVCQHFVIEIVLVLQRFNPVCVVL